MYGDITLIVGSAYCELHVGEEDVTRIKQSFRDYVSSHSSFGKPNTVCEPFPLDSSTGQDEIAVPPSAVILRLYCSTFCPWPIFVSPWCTRLCFVVFESLRYRRGVYGLLLFRARALFEIRSPSLAILLVVVTAAYHTPSMSSKLR